MKTDLGQTAPSLTTPTAVRSRRPGWRDPRLWIGLALVAGSVLLGIKVFTAADDSVPVWVAASDLHPGIELDPADLTSRQVRFVDAGSADRYLAATDPIPAGAQVSREVSAGELLPRSALLRGGAPEPGHRLTVVFSSGVGSVDHLREGDRVDVWVTDVQQDSGGSSSGSAGEVPPSAVLTLTDVLVVSVSATASDLSGASASSVTLELPDGPAARVARTVSGAKTDNIYLAQVG